MNRVRTAITTNLTALCGLALVALLGIEGLDRSAAGQAPASEGAAHSHHDHGTALSLPLGPMAPTLGVEVNRDPKSGWNLRIQTTNFRFSPENASGPHRTGEGHAHLYVNGQKLARLYGPWYHIDELPRGDVDVTVTLNSNDHRPLAIGATPLEVSKALVVE